MYIVPQGEILEVSVPSFPPIATLFRFGNILHEHRAPEVAFSEEALLQVQWRALSLPQEHLACAAQAQIPPPEVLQQVEDG